jgi:hypothetical protein
MPDYSLLPVDHQPDFDDYSLVLVDYDPFAADGVAQQAQIQLAQAQPQQPPPAGAGRPDAGAPAAGGVLDSLTENGRFDSYVYKKLTTGTHQQALGLVLPTVVTRSRPLTAPTARISVGFMDIR